MHYQLLKYAVITFLISTGSFIYSYVPYRQVADTTFDTQVKVYLAAMKQKIATMQDGIQLLNTLNIYATASLSSVEKFVDEIRNTTISQTEISTDQFHITALIQLTLPVIEQFKKDVMDLIVTLEVSKKYWELQREHPLNVSIPYVQQVIDRHHKNIDDKIIALDTCLNKQFSHLGSLALHLNSFDECKTPQEHFAWIQGLCTIIIAAYPNTTLNPHEASFDIVAKMLVSASRCTMYYATVIRMQIAPYLMPNIIMRHWIKWLGAAFIAGYGTYQAYTKQEIIEQRVKQGTKSIVDYGKSQIALAQEALFGGEISAEKLKKEEAILKQYYEDTLLALHKAFTYVKKDDEGKLEEQEPQLVEHPSIKQLSKAVQGIFTEDAIKHPEAVVYNFTYQQGDTIGCAPAPDKAIVFDPTLITSEFKLDAALDYMSNVIFPILGQVSKAEGKKLAAAFKEIGDQMRHIDYSFDSFVDPKDKTSYVYRFATWGSQPTAPAKDTNEPKYKFSDFVAAMGAGPIKNMSSLIDTGTQYPAIATLYGRLQKGQGKQFLWEMKKHNLIGLAIFSTIPACLVMWAAAKMLHFGYKKIRGVKLYDSVRDVLVDIALLLNIYGDSATMALEDVGRLIHLVDYRLEREQYNIPREFRTSFMHDIQLLRSSTLSAAKKLHVIQLIFKRYPFLMHDPRTI